MKSRTTAAILAFFFGWIGVHRFYLGQTGMGFVYLLFFWTGIPAIVALVDMIVFLTTSEERFDAKYNPEYARNQYAAAPQQIVINNHMGQPNAQPPRQAPPAYQAPVHEPHPIRPNAERSFVFRDKGLELYQDYNFDEAVVELRKAVNVNPNDPHSHFALACIYSITEEIDPAFYHLERAVAGGYVNFGEIASHQHLAFLRKQADYEKFVKNGYVRQQKTEGLELTPLLSDDKFEDIERLAQLRDRGVLNEEEFQREKAKILR